MSGRSRLSRRRVVVTGAGVLSPLGNDVEILHRALIAGESGIRPPASEELRPLGEILAGELLEGPEAYLGDRNLRPLDRTSRLAAAVAELALRSSGLGRRGDGDEGSLKRSGLVLGTMFGSLRTISEFDRRALTAGPRYTKPFEFANSVINAAAGQAAISHGLAGINATVAGGAAAGVAALVQAADLLRAGRSQALLAGGVEELCPEGLWALAGAGLLCGSNGAGPDSVAVPFHTRRGGFWPAEGAALLTLEEEESARRRGARIRARLTGGGGAFDPSRGEDPQSAAGAVRRAVEAALADAELSPSQVDLVSLSACGSPGGDPREAAGVGAALGERAGEVALTAVRGALGESLGAGGALQAVVALEALATGCLPGIHGLDEPEAGCGLAPAILRAAQGPARGTFRRALVTARAWDGPAWALVLEVP